MINVPGCCHVRSYEYVNLWKCFGPLKKHDPSTVSACVGANWQHPEICMVWHFCRWSQTLLPKRELKFSSVFLATRRPGMWTLPFPVDNILSEMCRVTFLLGWWTSSRSSRSKKCGKSSRRIPLDILTQDDIYIYILGLNSHILEGLKSHKITVHLSTGVFVGPISWCVTSPCGSFIPGNFQINRDLKAHLETSEFQLLSFECIIWKQSSWSSETRRTSTQKHVVNHFPMPLTYVSTCAMRNGCVLS